LKQYPDIEYLADANLDDVRELIRSCSYFNNKAKNIIKMARGVIEDFNGEIPLNRRGFNDSCRGWTEDG